LGETKLVPFPSSIPKLRNLRKLHLLNTHITDISALKGLTNLNELSLTKNQIIDISPLQGLTSLKELYLSANKITDISPLQGLNNLTRLFLVNNQIRELPEEFLKLKMEIVLGKDQSTGIHLRGTSPVLVVLNKIDENPGYDVNRRFLLEKYPNIKGFYPVSCATGEGIADFKEALNRELAAVELIRTTWAKNWFNVKSRLEHMTENFISYDRYQEICAEEKITGASAQDTLVDFLNDLGVILHFKDFHLQETQVLEPRWITTAVYKIINSPILAAGHGVLALSHLNEIFKPAPGEEPVFRYPPDKYPYILQLMKKFELCYALDEEQILVPDLLAVAEPKLEFQRAGALEFRFHYNFLPKSIMPRFLVKRHLDIKGDLRWRTGMVLEDKDCDAIALVKADEREQKIFISITGSRKRDYFAVLRKTFRDIHDSFEKLAVEEWIPLPDNDNSEKIAVEYRELLGYEKAGRHEIFIGVLGKSYSVAQLLSGIEKPEDRQEREVRVIEREIIREPVPAKKKRFPLIWKIAAGITGFIAFIAALVAIFDSQTAKKFWDWLTGLFK
jgi:GTPase SAR1 family protein